MAYNIFKRPMFKRGGATTGTGIMSHVEPRAGTRIAARNGFFGLNFGLNQSPINPVTGKTAYQTMLDSRNTGGITTNIQDMFKGMTPRYPSYETQPQTIEQVYKEKADRMKKSGEALRASDDYMSYFDTESKGTAAGDGIDEPENVMSANIIEQIIKNRKGNTGLGSGGSDPNVGKKTGSKYVGSDIESEVKDEVNLLNKLLKNENYSKGELALIVAGAMQEPGGISEKLNKARELALPVAKRRRDEDRAVTLAAYKLAKEKQQQEIKANATPKELRILRASAEAQAKATGGDADKIYEERLASFGGLDDATQRAVASMYAGSGTIFELVNSIKDARRRREEALSKGKKTDKIDAEITQLTSDFDTYRTAKGFKEAFPQLINFKEGGRVMRALGTGKEGETDIISSQVSFTPENTETTKDATVVEKPVEKLTYQQLRDRLPPEITDDVVQMLASSEEALQDFAYISTQADVNAFNVKYGVNLVIPPTKA